MSELTCDNCRFLEFSKYDEPCADCNKNSNWEAKPVIKDSGERREFETGAVRDCAEGKGRCDLLPLDVVADFMDNKYYHKHANVLRNIGKYMIDRDEKHLYSALKYFAGIRDWYFETMVLEYAKHLEDGAKKYAERNWEKGIPAHCYVDSAVRHLLKNMRGDTDEPHDRAFVWNIFGLIWTIRYHPECDDLPPAKKEEADGTED